MSAKVYVGDDVEAAVHRDRRGGGRDGVDGELRRPGEDLVRGKGVRGIGSGAAEDDGDDDRTVRAGTADGDRPFSDRRAAMEARSGDPAEQDQGDPIGALG